MKSVPQNHRLFIPRQAASHLQKSHVEGGFPRAASLDELLGSLRWRDVHRRMLYGEPERHFAW
jgi:hypothetical protein